jgi:hypothetical protein
MNRSPSKKSKDEGERMKDESWEDNTLLFYSSFRLHPLSLLFFPFKDDLRDGMFGCM